MVTHMPCTRHISIEKIDNMVEFLPSDKANYVPGSTLFVHGGMTLYPAFDFTFHPGEKQEDAD
jgi:enoyl-[acyl-carrier-protein] reductase (NADH)